MSGNYSRLKGKRNEYALRDHFKELGYESHRVPSSGAAQGFKGDITISTGGMTAVAELKARKDAFKSIYVLLDDWKSPIAVVYDTNLMIVSYNFADLGVFSRTETLFVTPSPEKLLKYKRPLNKLKSAKDWLQSCDFLVLKDDYKPFIFVRYL